jgi:ATP-binding cassette subfamily B protein
LTYAFRKVLKKLHKDIQEKDGVLRVFLQERIGNLMVLKSFTAEDQTEQEAINLMTDHKKARMRRNHFSNFCNIGFGAAMQGMYLMGAVYCAWPCVLG